jgi:hypothetical protein
LGKHEDKDNSKIKRAEITMKNHLKQIGILAKFLNISKLKAPLTTIKSPMTPTPNNARKMSN